MKSANVFYSLFILYKEKMPADKTTKNLVHIYSACLSVRLFVSIKNKYSQIIKPNIFEATHMTPEMVYTLWMNRN